MSILVFDQISEPIDQRLAVGLSKVSLVLKRQSWKDSDKQGLTPTQGQILTWLWSRPGAPLRLSAVAEMLGLTRATTSDAVTALVRKGLVSKHRSQEDKRAIALRLTTKGSAIAEKLASWPDFLLRAVDTLSPEEQETFNRALIKIIRTFQVEGQVSVSRMCVTCKCFRPNVHEDTDAPHHCTLVDAPFGDRHLRIDCPEHDSAPPEVQEFVWAAYLKSSSGSEEK